MKAKGWTYIHVVQKHKNPAIPQKYKHVYNTDVFLSYLRARQLSRSVPENADSIFDKTAVPREYLYLEVQFATKNIQHSDDGLLSAVFFFWTFSIVIKQVLKNKY